MAKPMKSMKSKKSKLKKAKIDPDTVTNESQQENFNVFTGPTHLGLQSDDLSKIVDAEAIQQDLLNLKKDKLIGMTLTWEILSEKVGLKFKKSYVESSGESVEIVEAGVLSQTGKSNTDSDTDNVTPQIGVQTQNHCQKSEVNKRSNGDANQQNYKFAKHSNISISNIPNKGRAWKVNNDIDNHNSSDSGILKAGTIVLVEKPYHGILDVEVERENSKEASNNNADSLSVTSKFHKWSELGSESLDTDSLCLTLLEREIETCSRELEAKAEEVKNKEKKLNQSQKKKKLTSKSNMKICDPKSPSTKEFYFANALHPHEFDQKNAKNLKDLDFAIKAMEEIQEGDEDLERDDEEEDSVGSFDVDEEEEESNSNPDKVTESSETVQKKADKKVTTGIAKQKSDTASTSGTSNLKRPREFDSESVSDIKENSGNSESELEELESDEEEEDSDSNDDDDDDDDDDDSTESDADEDLKLKLDIEKTFLQTFDELNDLKNIALMLEKKESSHSDDEKSDSENPEEEETDTYDLPDQLTFRHKIRHNCLGFYTNSEQFSHALSFMKFTGTGLYLLSSLFNHSCCPNLARFCIGDVVFFTTTRDVKPGEELCFSYIETDLLGESLKVRRSNLDRDFVCGCDRCVRDNVKVTESKGLDNSGKCIKSKSSDSESSYARVDSQLTAHISTQPPQVALKMIDEYLNSGSTAKLKLLKKDRIELLGLKAISLCHQGLFRKAKKDCYKECLEYYCKEVGLEYEEGNVIYHMLMGIMEVSETVIVDYANSKNTKNKSESESETEISINNNNAIVSDHLTQALIVHDIAFGKLGVTRGRWFRLRMTSETDFIIDQWIKDGFEWRLRSNKVPEGELDKLSSSLAEEVKDRIWKAIEEIDNEGDLNM